jgi:hypothetical protein
VTEPTSSDAAGAEPDASAPPADPAPPAPETRLARVKRIAERLRKPLLAIVLLGAISEFAYFVHADYAIGDWLFWRYAQAWALCAFWSAACLSTGHLVLHRLRRTFPIHEHLLVSIAIGAFVFCLGTFVFGVLHLLGRVYFWAWPSVMLAAGAVPLARYLRRAARLVRWQRARSVRAPWWHLAVFAFGVIGFLMVYFIILTPDNAAYDARWKHLAVAETYAVEGGIRRFPEGWTVVTYPHLVSVLFTWCFLVPGRLFDRIELCAHLEFVIFVWTTVAGIPAIVRRLVPRASAGLTWPARFLFPGVFLYDSSLSMGADHVGAVWAVASYTLLLRAWRDLSPVLCALLAFTLAAGIQTKMTALLLLLPFPIAALLIRAAILGLRAARGRLDPALAGRWYRGPLAALAMGLVCTAPFWLKNWIWYGDPVYPVFYKVLKLRPWTPDSATIFQYGYGGQFWRPSRDLHGVIRTGFALFDFSFIPNDWKKFHGILPVFGSLFTLSLACLPFLKRTGRIWALVACVELSIGTWYWTHHQDRYLQTIVPLMAAATAGVFILVWRTSLAARAAMAGLIALQIIWGGDVYFFPTHAMIRSPVTATAKLLASGFEKRFDARERWFASFYDVGQALPPRSRLLLHEIREHVGVNASTVSDFVGWQGGISYGRLDSAREVYDLLKGMGVTHLVWDTTVSKSWDSLAGDIRFFDFALRHGASRKKIGKMTFAGMPAEPPPASSDDEKVAFLGCAKTYANGLYTLPDMRVPVFGPGRRYPRPREGADLAPEAMIARARFVVLDPKCHKMPVSERWKFVHAATRQGYEIVKKTGLQIWIRTIDAPSPSSPSPSPSPATAEPPAEPEPDVEPTDAPGPPGSPDPTEGEPN